MTVGDALREALPNSMILIASGRYVESTLMLDKPGIVLQASGDGLPVITSYGTTVCISATVQLHGLHITTEAPSTAALVVAQGQPLISKCHLRSLHVDMASTPVVEHCQITGSGRCGLVICGAAKGEFRHNVIKNHRYFGILVSGTAAPHLSNNMVQQTGLGGIAVAGGATPVLKTNTLQDSSYTPAAGDTPPPQLGGANVNAGGLSADYPAADVIAANRVAVLSTAGGCPTLENNTLFSSVAGALACVADSPVLTPGLLAMCLMDDGGASASSTNQQNSTTISVADLRARLAAGQSRTGASANTASSQLSASHHPSASAAAASGTVTSLNLSRNIIRDNAGIGLLVRGSHCQVFSDANAWDNNEGGAIRADGGGTATLKRDNIGTHSHVGVDARGPGTVVSVLNCTLSGCSTGMESALGATIKSTQTTIDRMVRAAHVFDGGVMDISDATFTGNDQGLVVEDYGVAACVNCNFSGNSLAVVCSSHSTPNVRACNFKKNGTSVVSSAGARGVIEMCTFADSTLHHVVTSHRGNTCFSQNQFQESKGCIAVCCRNGGLGVFKRNTITAHRMACVKIETGADPEFVDNTFDHCGSESVLVERLGLGTFVANKIKFSASSGVVVRSGGDPTFRSNEIFSNANYAFDLQEGARGTYEKNIIRDNLEGGVCLSGSSTSWATVAKNRIAPHPVGIMTQDSARGLAIGNVIRGCGIGVRMCRGSSTAIVRNIVTENGIGITVTDDGTHPVIAYNTIDLNTQVGIAVTAGTQIRRTGGGGAAAAGAGGGGLNAGVGVAPMLMGNVIAGHLVGIDVGEGMCCPRVLQCLVLMNRIGLDITGSGVTHQIKVLDSVFQGNGFGVRVSGAGSADAGVEGFLQQYFLTSASAAAEAAVTGEPTSPLDVSPPSPTNAPPPPPLARFSTMTLKQRKQLQEQQAAAAAGEKPPASPWSADGGADSSAGKGPSESPPPACPALLPTPPISSFGGTQLVNIAVIGNGVGVIARKHSLLQWNLGFGSDNARGGLVVADAGSFVKATAVLLADHPAFGVRIAGVPLPPESDGALPSSGRRGSHAALSDASLRSTHRPAVLDRCVFVGPTGKTLVQHGRSNVQLHRCVSFSIGVHIASGAEAAVLNCVSRLRTDMLTPANVAVHVGHRSRALLHGSAVSGFDEGVRLERCEATLVGCHVSHCAWHGFILGHGSLVTMDGCAAFRNGGAGLRVYARMLQAVSVVRRCKFFNQVSTFQRTTATGQPQHDGSPSGGQELIGPHHSAPLLRQLSRQTSLTSGAGGGGQTLPRGAGSFLHSVSSAAPALHFELPDVNGDAPFTGVETDPSITIDPSVATLPKYTCPPSDGPGLGILVDAQGVLIAEHCEVFSNAISNIVVASAKNRSFLGNVVSYAAEGYGLVVRPNGLIDLKDCHLLSNALVGVLAESQSSARLSGCNIKGNGIGVLCCHDATELTRCLLEDHRICGVRFVDGSKAQLSDCLILRNATGVESRHTVTTMPTLTRCDMRANVYCGLLCTASSRPTLDSCRIREHHGVAGVLVRCLSSPSFVKCLFDGNTHAMVLRMAAAPTLTQCVIRQNRTGMLTEWGAKGQCNDSLYTHNEVHALISRTNSETTFERNQFFDESPVLVTTEGRAVLRANLFTRPKGSCIIVNRGGAPTITGSVFACTHASEAELIALRLAVRRSVKEHGGVTGGGQPLAPRSQVRVPGGDVAGAAIDPLEATLGDRIPVVNPLERNRGVVNVYTGNIETPTSLGAPAMRTAGGSAAKNNNPAGGAPLVRPMFLPLPPLAFLPTPKVGGGPPRPPPPDAAAAASPGERGKDVAAVSTDDPDDLFTIPLSAAGSAKSVISLRGGDVSQLYGAANASAASFWSLLGPTGQPPQAASSPRGAAAAVNPNASSMGDVGGASAALRDRVPIRIEIGGKGTVHGNVFAFNSPCSVLVESSMSEPRIEQNLFYGHAAGDVALLVSNYANPALEGNLFIHNDLGVFLTRTPSILSHNIFMNNSIGVESDVGVTGLISSSTFVEDRLSVSILPQSGLSVRKCHFIRPDTAALLRRDAQGVFAENVVVGSNGPGLLIDSGPAKPITVDNCQFVKCYRGAQISPNSTGLLTAIDAMGCTDAGVCIIDAGSVVLKKCKLALGGIGVVCEGPSCIPVLEDCALLFNRVGLETFNHANPSVQISQIHGNKTGFLAHADGFGTLSRVEFQSNNVGVAIKTGVEGLPSLSHCNILDCEDTGIVLGADACGDLTDVNVFDSKVCVAVSVDATTSISETNLSHPDPQPMVGQPDTILRRTTHDGSTVLPYEGPGKGNGLPRLRLGNGVNMLYDRIPPYSQIQSRMRKSEQAKARSNMGSNVDKMAAGFLANEREARDATAVMIRSTGLHPLLSDLVPDYSLKELKQRATETDVYGPKPLPVGESAIKRADVEPSVPSSQLNVLAAAKPTEATGLGKRRASVAFTGGGLKGDTATTGATRAAAAPHGSGGSLGPRRSSLIVNSSDKALNVAVPRLLNRKKHRQRQPNYQQGTGVAAQQHKAKAHQRKKLNKILRDLQRQDSSLLPPHVRERLSKQPPQGSDPAVGYAVRRGASQLARGLGQQQGPGAPYDRRGSIGDDTGGESSEEDEGDYMQLYRTESVLGPKPGQVGGGPLSMAVSPSLAGAISPAPVAPSSLGGTSTAATPAPTVTLPSILPGKPAASVSPPASTPVGQPPKGSSALVDPLSTSTNIGKGGPTKPAAYRQSLLPSLPFVPSNSSRAFPRMQQPLISPGGLTARPPQDKAAVNNKAMSTARLPPLLHEGPLSQLALMCFAFPQNGKFGYGSDIHGDIMLISKRFNPLFADQVLQEFRDTDRRKRGVLSLLDVVQRLVVLCETYHFHPARHDARHRQVSRGASRKALRATGDEAPGRLGSPTGSAGTAAMTPQPPSSRDGDPRRPQNFISLGPDGGTLVTETSLVGMPSEAWERFGGGGADAADGGNPSQAAATQPAAASVRPMTPLPPSMPLAQAVSQCAKYVWTHLLKKASVDEDLTLAEYAEMVSSCTFQPGAPATLLPAPPIVTPMTPLFETHFTWMRRRLALHDESGAPTGVMGGAAADAFEPSVPAAVSTAASGGAATAAVLRPRRRGSMIGVTEPSAQ